MKHCLIFSRKVFHVTIVLIKITSSLVILPIIRFDYTIGPLRKHDAIKVCCTEYLTTEIELASPTFESWTVYKIKEYLTLGLLSSLLL